MKYHNFLGVDSPAINFTNESETVFVAPLGIEKKVNPASLPFSTSGDWDTDSANFLSIFDYTGLDAPVDYKHAREITLATTALLPDNYWEEVDDDFFNIPTQQEIDDHDLEVTEIQWANGEISRSREMLDCHAFGCTDATETEQDWKDYWVALRAHIKAPVGLLANRPAAPDAV